MSLLSSHDQQHLARMFAQEQRVNGLYNRFISSVSPELRKWKDSGRTNVWLRNSAIENLIDKRLLEFKTLLENEIKSGSLKAWDLSDEKNDRLVENYIKNLSLSETAKNGMFVRNADALAGFQNRVDNGLTLSDKVWNITKQTKGNVELYLQSGIGTGQSAETIGRDIRQLLNEPDKVFRRIRDKNGNLIPSKPMKNYHPGAGTYRSSKKNAMRVAATETNMGYRVADSERWKTLDFVLGFEIKRSGNGGPCSVCDSLKGKYPKGFIFSGWHSWCICFAVPILMGHDDFADFLMSDNIPSNQLITEIPKGAEEWLAANEKLVEKSYWKKANTEILNKKSINNIPATSKSIESAEIEIKKINITQEDFTALKYYTGTDYFPINNYLRGVTNDLSEKNSITINSLDKFIEKAPKIEFESYRGMSIQKDKFNEYLSLKKGEIFVDKGYISTSYVKDIANEFRGSDDTYFIEMNIKGKNGVLIKSFSNKPDECEIIFGRRSKFEIENIDINENAKSWESKMILTLKEI